MLNWGAENCVIFRCVVWRLFLGVELFIYEYQQANKEKKDGDACGNESY